MIGKIMITGRPASGKTTAIEVLKELAEENGIRVNLIDDFGVLLELCPKSEISPRYFYDEGGSLILRDEHRDKIMRDQFDRLRELWEQDQPKDEITILEITHPLIGEMVPRYFLGGNMESALLYLSSEKDVSDLRNANRSSDHRIPQVYLDSFVGSDQEIYSTLEQMFGTKDNIVNSGINLDTFKAKVTEVCRNWMRK